MDYETEEEMRALGKATGAVISRAEASVMIDGLLETIRELRQKGLSIENERSIFNLKAAIEGIREGMLRE